MDSIHYLSIVTVEISVTGVGYAMVVSVALICVYYNMVNAWAFHYLFSSFTASLPWASCDNKWNTEGRCTRS